MRFRTAFYRLVPSWLRGGEGERVLYSLGLMMDAMAERFRLSHEADLPDYAPADAFPYLGRDRAIRRGINEPQDAYAARLIRYLDDHRTQGNPFTLMRQIRAYLQTDVRVRTVDAAGNYFTIDFDGTESVLLAEGTWNWDGFPTRRDTRFWVIVYPIGGTDPWATLAAWPAVTTPATTTATSDAVRGLVSLIREWKPAGTRCEWIIVAHDDSTFDPTAAMEPDGTWGDWSTLDGTHKSRSRETTARYFVGH